MQGGDGYELLDADFEWCCDSCNCKDLSDASRATTCDAGQNQCSGHYVQDGDGFELLDADFEWCCDSCNYKDLTDA